MKYSDEILVTPPGLGKNFNPPAMPQLPNSTKEEMSMRLRLSSPSTTASLSCTFPKPWAWAIAGNKKLKFLRYLSWDLVATWKSSHSCWYRKKNHWKTRVRVHPNLQGLTPPGCPESPDGAAGDLSVLSHSHFWQLSLAGNLPSQENVWSTTGYLPPQVFFPKTRPGVIFWCLQNN